MSHENLEIVFTDFVDAIRRKDLDTIAARLDPEVVWQGVREDLLCRDRNEVLDVLRGQFEGPGLRVEAVELADAGDEVVLGVRGPELPEPADLDVGGQIHNVITLRDGKIVRMRDYLKRAEAFAAAGAEPPAWR